MSVWSATPSCHTPQTHFVLKRRRAPLKTPACCRVVHPSPLAPRLETARSTAGVRGRWEVPFLHPWSLKHPLHGKGKPSRDRSRQAGCIRRPSLPGRYLLPAQAPKEQSSCCSFLCAARTLPWCCNFHTVRAKPLGHAGRCALASKRVTRRALAPQHLCRGPEQNQTLWQKACPQVTRG